jgi:hypothetical protein
MFNRTCAFFAVAVMAFGVVGAAPTFAATPIDPAGTYHEHGTAGLEGCTMTLTDTRGIVAGDWSDDCGGAGLWTVSGKAIALSSPPTATECSLVFSATVGKKGFSSAKKPGILYVGETRCIVNTYTWWATK